MIFPVPMDFDQYFIAAGNNFHVLMKVLEEYETLGIEPPKSFARYFARQYIEASILVMELEARHPEYVERRKNDAMPQADYAAAASGLAD